MAYTITKRRLERLIREIDNSTFWSVNADTLKVVSIDAVRIAGLDKLLVKHRGATTANITTALHAIGNASGVGVPVTIDDVVYQDVNTDYKSRFRAPIRTIGRFRKANTA